MSGFALDELYNELFDETWYLKTYPAVKLLLRHGRVADARAHFGEQGYRDWHSPGPLFDTRYYARQSNYHPSGPRRSYPALPGGRSSTSL